MLECAVVGVPSELSEVVKAFKVPAPGRQPDFAALRAHAAARLTAFKVPRYWQLIDELPRTPTARVADAAVPAGHPAEEYDAESEPRPSRPSAPVQAGGIPGREHLDPEEQVQVAVGDLLIAGARSRRCSGRMSSSTRLPASKSITVGRSLRSPCS